MLTIKEVMRPAWQDLRKAPEDSTTTTTVMIVFTCTSGLLDLCPRSYLPPWTLSAYPVDSYHILSFYHTLSFSAHPVNLSKFIIWLFVRRLQSQQKKLVKKSHFPPFEQCACAFVGHFFVFWFLFLIPFFLFLAGVFLCAGHLFLGNYRKEQSILLLYWDW